MLPLLRGVTASRAPAQMLCNSLVLSRDQSYPSTVCAGHPSHRASSSLQYVTGSSLVVPLFPHAIKFILSLPRYYYFGKGLWKVGERIY